MANPRNFAPAKISHYTVNTVHFVDSALEIQLPLHNCHIEATLKFLSQLSFKELRYIRVLGETGWGEVGHLDWMLLVPYSLCVGMCEVEPSEKGWYIKYIDRSPETLARQAVSTDDALILTWRMYTVQTIRCDSLHLSVINIKKLYLYSVCLWKTLFEKYCIINTYRK